MPTRKILVTGGAGFIGSHLVDQLVKTNNEVRVLDSLDKQVHAGMPKYTNKKAEYVIGNVIKKEDVEKALEDVEIVFHQAAQVGVGQSMYEVTKYVNENIFGTSVLMQSIIEGDYPVKKVITASSMSIYGEGAYKCRDCGTVFPELRQKAQLKKRKWEMICGCGKPLTPAPTDEEKPLKPTSIYAISKKTQEELVLTLGRAYGIPAVALRYFNVYGPRQSLNNPYTGVAAIFSSRIKNNKPPIIFEDGLQSRDFVYVSDIVKANILAMKSKKADYDYFNVGTGRAITIKQVAEALIKIHGKRLVPEINNKFREGDIRHCFSDISKIRRLGFGPAVKFEDGLRLLAGWSANEKAVDKTDIAMKELGKHGLVER